MKFDLHRVARSIFSICIQSGIHWEVQWIPRSLNQQADYISRLIDIDDWQITNEFSLFLDGHWGPYTVDCFANFYNHKLAKLFSRFWNPGTAGVPNSFQDFGIQALPVLISSFSLLAGRIASSFHQWVLSPAFCIIWSLRMPLVLLSYLSGHRLITGR